MNTVPKTGIIGRRDAVVEIELRHPSISRGRSEEILSTISNNVT